MRKPIGSLHGRTGQPGIMMTGKREPGVEALLETFTKNIEAWRPSSPRSGCAKIFRTDRAELSKIRTAFKRGRYKDVIEMTDMLDTIIRARVPYAMLTYCQNHLRLHDT